MANTHSINLELSSSQFLSLLYADQTGLDFTSNFTIECWVKLEQLPSTAGSIMGLVTRYEESTNKSYRLFILNNDILFLDWTGDGTSYSREISNSAFVTSADVGEWVHIAATVNPSTKDVIFYKNGTVVSSTLDRNSASSLYAGTSNFYIGSLDGGNNLFDGLMDDVRIWTDIRTSTEISDNMSKELVGNETGLVGYWKLNNSLLDETSNDNDLTNNNSSTFSTEVPFGGVAASIDLESSSSQYLSITDGDQTGLDITGDITIEAWIKLETLSTVFGVVTKGTNTGDRDREYNLYVGDTSSKKLAFSHRESSDTYSVVSDGADLTSNWTHIAVTVSGANVIFYINGVKDGNTKTLSGTRTATSGDFYIGTLRPLVWDFDGKIDDVRVWSDVRTATEIADNYRKELVGNETGLVGYWKLNNSLLDETSNDNDLTNNNTATFSTDVPSVSNTSNFLQFF